MFLEKLSLQKFRNYNQADLIFSSPITFFIGKNGSGKTSLLEAIYCALRGQSFHSFVQSQFIKKGEKTAKISLFLKEKEGSSQVQSSFFLKDFSMQKEHLYCGKKVRSSFFLKKFPCFVFTEASLKCIRQGPYERRDFIESLFYTDDQLRSKREFYQVFKQKKQLLKNYKKELIKDKDFFSLFSVMNQTFLEKSKNIVQSRLEILNQIFKFLPTVSQSFLNSITQLSFSYQIKENVFKQESQTYNKNTEQNQELEGQKLSICKALEEDLKEKKQLEIQTGLLLSGPQKHEILFLFEGEDSRSFCSKGQQRAYILSLLLSHLKSIPQAFLFLDDVLLELDESVQEKFLHFLEKNHCQVFLTNSNMIPFKVKNSSFFYIERGQIEKHS